MVCVDANADEIEDDEMGIGEVVVHVRTCVYNKPSQMDCSYYTPVVVWVFWWRMQPRKLLAQRTDTVQY